jgi:hypothetical protein
VVRFGVLNKMLLERMRLHHGNALDVQWASHH